MGERPSEPNAPQSELSPSERLESWKEIAAYLKRDVRTVQRWEKGEGLPVHRHLHEKLGTVYTYKSELDAWWNNRRPKLEAEEARGKEAGKRWSRWLAVAAVAVVVAAGVGMWLAQRSPLAFEERDWVLIASFENRTGEEVFDGTLEYALERELSNSRFVNVVPRERINDTLQLMKKPLDTSIDAAVGREVALRDGGIRALITGRVERLDTTYLLSASLVNPASGVTVASFTEDAEGRKVVVPAIRRLANRVRESLGEELASIEQSEQKLEKVTTPSLRALQLFSQGSLLKEQRQFKAAEQFLREAIAEDPEFASAYLWLAYALMNQRRPADEYMPHVERALALSETVTEHERYFILGSYYMFAKQYEKAVGPYQALLRIYPDHRFAPGNLARAYVLLRRPQEAIPYLVRRADLRPNDFLSNWVAASRLAVGAANPVAAQAYFGRARALASPEIIKRFPGEAAWMESYPAREHWFRGNVAQALSEVTPMAQTMKSRIPRERQRLGVFVGTLYLRLGKLKAAEEAFQNVRSSDLNYWLAWVAFARGNGRAFREQLVTARRPGSRLRYVLAFLLARAGLLAEAENMLLTLEKDFSEERFLEKQFLSEEQFLSVVRGELALAQGRTEEAISLLQDALEGRGRRMPGKSYWETFFLGSESLAHAWEQQGNFSKALKVLEEASEEKRNAAMYFGSSAYCWIRVQARLAQVYRKVGREEEAQEIEGELLKLLAYADSDHPILRQLKQQREVAHTQSPK